MTSSHDPSHAVSFGRAAATYDQARPGYPAQAVDWMLPAGARDVADVGAGTGKLSALLAEGGRSVVAVDPDPDMLATLATRYAGAGIVTEVGSAEDLPLPTGSVDAVTFAQAWHWVDVERASTEAARVLRPGGRLGLVWNIRDSRVPWVAELGRVMKSSAAEDLIEGDRVRLAEPFSAPEHRVWDWAATLDVEGLVNLAASRSYVITRPEGERAEVLGRVRSLAQEVAGESGSISLPYRTHAFRADLPATT